MRSSLRLLPLLCVLARSAVGDPPSQLAARALLSDSESALKRQNGPGPSEQLVTFQVSSPVLTPNTNGSSNEYGCVVEKVLMEHDFANSYGAPFVGDYTPPACTFNRVTINFTVTVAGRQFDRLGIMYLGDTEVWRTSTAEPTTDGIIWSYAKEMQQYDALWRQDQKIIFDIGNLVNPVYTGVFHATMTATFFTVPDSPPVADQVLPISALMSASNKPSAFQIPGVNASVAYSIPKVVQRAVVSLSACGQIGEEFWYTNTFTSEENTFANTTGTLPGGSPWREVQILIDGQLAGISWPFPVIFTGGIVPGFWRPIVGIDAFDLREHEIDVTPWLPYLQDGGKHTFEIRVASLDDSGNVATLDPLPGSYWVVSGKIFLFSGPKGSSTTGDGHPTISAPPPTFSISSHVTKDSSGANQTLTYTTAAKRHLSVSAVVNGKRVSWTQSLSYDNYNALTQQGQTQYTKQTTTGSDEAVLPDGYANGGLYSSSYSYPITVNSSYSVASSGATSINGSLSRSLDVQSLGPTVFPSGVQPFNTTLHKQVQPGGPLALVIDSPLLTHIQPPSPASSLSAFAGSSLSETQTGTASYYSANSSSASYSFGTTAVDYSFKGVQQGIDTLTTELYARSVQAANSSIVYDRQTLLGERVGDGGLGKPAGGGNAQVFVGVGVKATLGRGPPAGAPAPGR